MERRVEGGGERRARVGRCRLLGLSGGIGGGGRVWRGGRGRRRICPVEGT